MANSEELTSNVQLDYENRFGKHHIHAVGGLEARSGNYPSIYILGSQEANGIPNLNIKSLTSMTDNVSFVQRRLGFLGRVNYDYDSKYIAEFSGRYDGSFFYKSGKRFGFFPSGSVAYRISQEEFWKNNSFLSKTINDFKIRGSYGVLGQELGSALSYITGYNFNQGSSILDGRDVVSSRVTGLATDNITWGRVYVFDVGFDAGFLRNRLTTSFSWFDRNSTGQLASRYDVLLPNEVGFGLPEENLNSDRTRGLEFSAQWTDKLQNGLSYSFGGNFTFSRWITGVRYKPHWSSSWDQYRDLGNIEGRYRDGSFQLVAVGQFQSWEQIANHKIDQDHVGNITIRPGDYIYQDVNNDGAINELDMQNVTYRVNNGTPFINFAFNFSTAYKNFDFRADFAGASCFTYEQQGYMRYFDGSGNVSQYLADNSSWYNNIWDKNSGISVGRYPLLTKGINNWMNTHWPNNFWQTNVTYVKLRNIELGYSLPKQWMQKAGIANLRIYVAAQNLLTISNMPGNLDPEITSNQGISYPNLRMFNAGFQIKL
jgi:TonB-linked SusC/RagA family outer membrane protein